MTSSEPGAATLPLRQVKALAEPQENVPRAAESFLVLLLLHLLLENALLSSRLLLRQI
jgi:hypothetical protein